MWLFKVNMTFCYGAPGCWPVRALAEHCGRLGMTWEDVCCRRRPALQPGCVRLCARLSSIGAFLKWEPHPRCTTTCTSSHFRALSWLRSTMQLHSLPFSSQPCKATASSSGAVRVRCSCSGTPGHSARRSRGVPTANRLLVNLLYLLSYYRTHIDIN